MRVVTVMNQKGGVGKTTTTLNLAAALREASWRVLVVDFDPQGSLTTCCGVSDPDRLGPGQTVADAVLTTVHGPCSRPVSLRDVIVKTRAGIDLVPSSQQLATAEAALYTVYGREYALRDTLADAQDDYDVVIVDSVPTFGLLAVNCLAAADGLIIPVQAEYLAVYGLAQLLQNVALVRERLNSRLDIWGVLLTMVDGRTRHCREIVNAVRETLPGQVPVFATQIPVDVKLKESSRAGVSVLAHDPVSRSAIAYRGLAVEVALYLKGLPIPVSVDAAVDDAAEPPEPPLSTDSIDEMSTASIEQTAATALSERTAGSICLATRLGPRLELPTDSAWDRVDSTINGVRPSLVRLPSVRLPDTTYPQLVDDDRRNGLDAHHALVEIGRPEHLEASPVARLSPLAPGPSSDPHEGLGGFSGPESAANGTHVHVGRSFKRRPRVLAWPT
ncbi:MAG TPA: ParA family protein [Chloroflexota bacterium]|nr:ParA family protein [Chloroflexota bacterium]